MKELHESEINRIVKENAGLSDKELLRRYFVALYHDVLGSQAEQMEEAGWEESDVRERREYENYMMCYADILERMLQERGIDPWDECREETENEEI